MTLGSLFDGSGGFPLAGLINNIEPKWASEITPFPILVTKKRIPKMEHLGDITKINGAEIEPVDIITFGSPCQDLSVAGERAGLEGNRSSLFFEAIRVVKEMRVATNNKYPRFILWENVPGAFSSSQGRDFRSVLDAIVKIKNEELSIPQPKKWATAGGVVADGFSLCWRVLDSQYFGVPQRRRRIYLVADFGGESSAEILFECEGLQGDFKESDRTGQGTATTTQESSRTTMSFRPGAAKRLGNSWWSEVSGTLMTPTNDNQMSVAIENRPQDSRCNYAKNNKIQTLDARMGAGGGNIPMVMSIQDNIIGRKSKNGPNGCGYGEDISFTLTATDKHAVAYSSTTGSFMKSYKNKASPICARDYKDPQIVAKEPEYVVRRLTPLECCRLQGFPDFWCEDLETTEPTESDISFWREYHPKKSDKQIAKWLSNPYSQCQIYKMWGNGIALPCAVFVLSQIYQKMLK